MMYNTTTLRNGLRIIHLPATSQIIYCGYQLAVGTRDEAHGQEGLAHFCEHMAFKGTESRNAMQVINYIEGVGGELSAYTSKDTTVFYAAVQNEHLIRAVRILTDIVFRSTCPRAERDKEVEVVCDEIDAAGDCPAELIYDEFENIIFRDRPLGHSIYGTKENVRLFSTNAVYNFARTHYTPANAVFFCYGDVDFEKLCRMLQKEKIAEGSRTKDKPAQPTAPPPFPERQVIKELGTHQAHVMIGREAYATRDPRRLPLSMLTAILGGPAMNAQLNLTLRERFALVYTVEAAITTYPDTGLWTIYFGCDPGDIDRCRQLVRKELDRLMQRPMSQKRLDAAKRQMKGQVALACDNREGFALDFGKEFLHYGRETDIDEICREIDAITPEELHAVAREMFDEKNLTTLIYK
ncbi:MAG: insulinase family protein [Prevotella sp.]|nr:insulinase family protein [Prevotella sp.]